MCKVLVYDLLFTALFLLLIATLGAWILGILIYPFGLLILISALLARWLHLAGKHSERANPPKPR